MKITLDIDRERTKQHSLKSISSKRRKEGGGTKSERGREDNTKEYEKRERKREIIK